MELLQLRYFYETALHESITKTAERYMVPPSSVSLSIKRLEGELGCLLFDRTGNRICLNARGRILQKALTISLGELDGAVAKLTESEVGEGGDIYLLVRSERQILLDCIADFRRDHPDAVFHLSHDYVSDQDRQFDLIIDDAAMAYKGFDSTPIIRENIRIAAAAGNPLCDRTLTLWDLREEPFITMYRGSSMQRITLECCSGAGFQPNIIIESDDPQYLRKYIELGLGLAFVPEISWKGQMGGTVYLNITDLQEQRVTAVYRNTARTLNPMAEAFYELLLRHRIGLE